MIIPKKKILIFKNVIFIYVWKIRNICQFFINNKTLNEKREYSPRYDTPFTEYKQLLSVLFNIEDL